MSAPASPEAEQAKPAEPTKFCTKCQADRPLPGGVQRTRESWHCGNCWRLFSMKRRTSA